MTWRRRDRPPLEGPPRTARAGTAKAGHHPAADVSHHTAPRPGAYAAVLRRRHRQPAPHPPPPTNGLRRPERPKGARPKGPALAVTQHAASYLSLLGFAGTDDNITDTAAPSFSQAPAPPSSPGDSDIKAPVIIFFVTLAATVGTAAVFGCVYWLLVSIRRRLGHTAGDTNTARRRQSPTASADREPRHSSLHDVMMQERLLHGDDGDDCDGDADGDVAPAAAYYQTGDRYEFLLLPEYAQAAALSGGGSGAGGDSGDGEDDRRSRVSVGSASVAPQRKWLAEWLNGVVAAYMEAQLAGTPLEPPVHVPPVVTLGSHSPQTMSASDRSDQSDVRPTLSRRALALRASRHSDSSNSNSYAQAAPQPLPSRRQSGCGVDRRHSPVTPDDNTPGAAGPATLVAAQPIEDSPPQTVAVVRVEAVSEAVGKPAAPSAKPSSRQHTPRQATPRKIIHDTSSSSSSDRSAHHARQQHQSQAAAQLLHEFGTR